MAHDLTGMRFGRLTVMEQQGKKHGRIAWMCLCDCGNEVALTSNRLLHKEGTKSCGCLRKETASKKATKHGMANTDLYITWKSMRSRCEAKSNKSYSYYGGRGIKVCERWKSFQNFYDDMNDGYSAGLTIDRIDNNGDYEPGNCRWVTQQEQLNNYSKNVMVTINGETDSLINMCRKYGVAYDKTTRRIKKGIDPLTALTAIYKNGTNQIIGYRQLK